MTTLSLCLIYKNEEKYISDAIESVIHLVDEAILVDSGSSDSSAEIVAKLSKKWPKIKALKRSWTNSFSDQKNYAIDHATSDWILFLDSDERILSEDHDKLRIAINDTNYDAYELPIRNYTRHFQQLGFQWDQKNPWAPGYYLTSLHRLFRRSPSIRYEGLIHETIEGSLIQCSAKTKALDVPIHHLGPLKEEDLHLKASRYTFYQELASKKVAENPEDPKSLWEWGVTLQKLRRISEAHAAFKKAYQLLPDEKIFEVYYFMSLFQNRDWKTLQKLNPKTKDAKFFVDVALAQEDAEKVENILSYKDLYPQTPLLAFELFLRHGYKDKADKLRDEIQLRFGSTGWGEFIEGAFYRQTNQTEAAIPLLKKASGLGCSPAHFEFGLALVSSGNIDEAIRFYKEIPEHFKDSFPQDGRNLFEKLVQSQKA